MDKILDIDINELAEDCELSFLCSAIAFALWDNLELNLPYWKAKFRLVPLKLICQTSHKQYTRKHQILKVNNATELLTCNIRPTTNLRNLL